jgi:hypothetical protein
VHDVDYSGFLADPIGTVASVRERQGSPLDAAARAAMTSYLQAHPQGRDGGHRHDVAALGVDEQALRARFARYTEAYGLG